MRAAILLFAAASLGAQTFPTVASKTYENTNNLCSACFSYQMTDYDSVHNQTLFYPYGSVSSSPLANSGSLLVYTPTPGGFATGANWEVLDLTSLVATNAYNFGGGWTDGSGPATSLAATTPTYAYLPPGPRNTVVGTIASQGDIAVQINLANLASHPTTPAGTAGTPYKYIDLATITGTTYVPSGFPAIGSFAGAWVNGSSYFCPTLSNQGAVADGILIRYNSALGAFDSANSWQYFNTNTIPSQYSLPNDTTLGGQQSAASVGTTLYLIPFFTGTISFRPDSKIIAYDTTKSFTTASSYKYFDLSTLFPGAPSTTNAHLNGFTGGVAVGGRYLVLVPWGVRNTQVTNSIALIYDTTLALNNPAAWQSIDLTTVNAKAAGYQYGWLDKWGYLWFVPTHNFNATTDPSIAPFVAWNTKLPFSQASSWNSYANNGFNGTVGACAGSPTMAGCDVWMTGASYNAATNTAWMSAYGAPPTSTPVEISYNLELVEAFTPPTSSTNTSLTGAVSVNGAP